VIWDHAVAQGWKNNPPGTWYNFEEAILTTGQKGRFTVLGRPTVNPYAGTSSNDLDHIPKYLLKGAQFYAVGMAAGGGKFGPGTALLTPADSRNRNAEPTQQHGYVDIQIPSAGLFKWLDEEAIEFKGKPRQTEQSAR
jgi:hypothetical protein